MSDHGGCGQRGCRAGMSGYRGGNDNAILGKVANGLKPTCAIFFERIPFEDGQRKLMQSK